MQTNFILASKQDPFGEELYEFILHFPVLKSGCLVVVGRIGIENIRSLMEKDFVCE